MSDYLTVLEPIAIGMIVTLDMATDGIRACKASDAPFGLAVEALLLGQQISRKDFFEGVTGPIRRTGVIADETARTMPTPIEAYAPGVLDMDKVRLFFLGNHAYILQVMKDGLRHDDIADWEHAMRRVDPDAKLLLAFGGSEPGTFTPLQSSDELKALIRSIALKVLGEMMTVMHKEEEGKPKEQE